MSKGEHNISTFDVSKIGPALAALLSFAGEEEFSFKEADYNAIVWDWNEQYPDHIDDLSGRCYILTTDNSEHPVFGENICLSYRFANPREDDSVCIGMINYDHKYRNYQNIEDGSITFYDYIDNDKRRLIELPFEDLMYGFIDSVIDHMQVTNDYDLDDSRLYDLLKDHIIRNNLINSLKLIRKKDE